MMRLSVGLLGAALLAWTGWRRGHLTGSGAIAATIVGSATAAAGILWMVLLLAFYYSSHALSRWRRSARARRLRGVVAKTGARDARQVLVNGGLLAFAGLASLLSGALPWHIAGAGAIACATADTWGTEIGTAVGQTPCSLRTRKRVAVGTSGAVTLAGCAATLAGATFIALITGLASWPGREVVAVVAGGTLGALADSVLGATVQEQRRCDQCMEETEQKVHRCGASTRHVAGIAAMDNDMVNLLSGGVGAAVALWLASGGIWK